MPPKNSGRGESWRHLTCLGRELSRMSLDDGGRECGVCRRDPIALFGLSLSWRDDAASFDGQTLEFVAQAGTLAAHEQSIHDLFVRMSVPIP